MNPSSIRRALFDSARSVALASHVMVVALWSGCAPFVIQTPSGMVELEEDKWSYYDYRATTPEGVVIAARQIRQREGSDVPPGDMEFWSDALRLRMRTQGGYALLEEVDVTSADGTGGLQLRFGRDQSDGTYVYWVTLFVTKKFVHVVEAGGRQDLFEVEQESIERTIEGYNCRR